MTVVAAYRVPNVGCVVMSDSRVSSGSGKVHSDVTRKTLRIGDLTLAITGSDQHALQDLCASKVRTYPALIEWMRTRDDKSAWCVYGYDSSNDKLFALEADLEFVEYDQWFAGGAGGELAAGALEVLPVPATLDEAVNVLQVAIAVAIKHNATCGGRRQWFRTRRQGRRK